MEIAVGRLAPLLTFLLAAGATFTIWTRGPLADYAYEAGILLLASVTILSTRVEWRANAASLWRNSRKTERGADQFLSGLEARAAPFALLGIAVFGFLQLALNGSVARWATLEAALRFSALTATAFVARAVLRNPKVRRRFLCGFAWFGFGTCLVSLLAYSTSVDRILWLAPSPYPDAWGPFLSRNNFAQFVELALPVALWLGLTSERAYLLPASVMFAAGLASASRAGTLLLIAEVLAALALTRKQRGRRELWLGVAALVLISAAAGTAVLARFHDSDPFLYRREIFQSTRAMIAPHPWSGYGLGSFALVYPQFAIFDGGSVVDHVHNDWLEWTAEGGLPFALLWSVLALQLCRAAVRSIWALGIVAVFVHALVDYPFARLGVAAWIFLLIGALDWGGIREDLPSRY